jgi:hypothetical protein
LAILLLVEGMQRAKLLFGCQEEVARNSRAGWPIGDKLAHLFVERRWRSPLEIIV